MKVTRVAGRPYALIAIGLISCSMLMYEVLLTRICALRLFFHFGFLVVSNCLLGIGASGSLIAVFQGSFEKAQRLWIWRFAVLYLVSLALTYAFLLTFPVVPGVSFSSIGEMVQFSAFNLTAAVPFFFAGCVIGLILTFSAEQVNRIYFVDLVGAGIGCLLCPLLLWKTGAGGCCVFLGLVALVATVVASPIRRRRLALVGGVVLGVGGLLLLPRLDEMFPVPSKPEICITERIAFEQPARPIYTRWSAVSRVDLVDIPVKKRYFFGQGHARSNDPLPEMKFIVQDGSAGTIAANWSEHPERLGTLKRTLYCVPVMLIPNARVLIIGVGGGSDVWAAMVYGAKYIKGIELNQQIIDMHEGVLSDYSKDMIEDPRVELVCDEGRSALMREGAKYDVIQMSGIDTWTSLASGAYVLAENYLYTVEAMATMYDRLNDGGILAISRFAKVAPLRVLSNVYAAIRDRGDGRLENSVACLSSDYGYAMTMLIKKGEFTPGELETLDRFATEEDFEVDYLPTRKTDSVVEEFVRSEDKDRFIREFPVNVSPTPDDCPYFFNFMKWTSPIGAAKLLRHKLTYLGNPLFIFGQLLVSTVLAVALILLPVLVFRRRGVDRRYLKRFLLYFTGLGLGFISIEIALMQKLVLFLGHPLYSVTVTLFAMLVFTGVGSLLSERWFRSPTRLAWIVPIALAVLLGLFILLSPKMVAAWIVWPKAARILVTAAVLAPISLLLGVPFAYGIRLLNRYNPTIIPWAWAVNGCTTVIGSILTVILSMNLGFNFVLVGAIIVYFAAFAAIRGLR